MVLLYKGQPLHNLEGWPAPILGVVQKVSSQYLGGTRPSWSLDASKMLAFFHLTPIY
ncbi:MAG TPA: hypothetical protein G4N99_11050 [Thermoflexia bacterium]|nr:hypothetical protein [Thermoflexia bacterium]